MTKLWLPAVLLVCGCFGIAATQSSLVVFAPEGVTVRAGPGTVYDRAGELGAGQTATAVGRSSHNDWIQIEVAGTPSGLGWVFADFVELQGGSLDQLPLMEAPPTPTLPPTPQGNVDPLLITPTSAPLPTFTPAPPVVVPTFENEPVTEAGGVPPILFILALFIIGLFGAVMAVIRRNV